MATLADFNFAASMITGHILEVYPSLTGAWWGVKLDQNNPKLWPESADFCRSQPRHKLGSKSTSRSHGSTPAGWPRWTFNFQGHWGLPCEALGLQQMGGGDEMSWQSKRLFYNGKKYDYDIYIIYIYICMYHVYVYTYTYTLYRYVQATLVSF